MIKREKYKKIKKEQKLLKIELTTYILSIILLLTTIILNLNITINTPSLKNGIILETNIIFIIICIYKYIINKKKISLINDKLLNIKIKNIINTI